MAPSAAWLRFMTLRVWRAMNEWEVVRTIFIIGQKIASDFLCKYTVQPDVLILLQHLSDLKLNTWRLGSLGWFTSFIYSLLYMSQLSGHFLVNVNRTKMKCLLIYISFKISNVFSFDIQFTLIFSGCVAFQILKIQMNLWHLFLFKSTLANSNAFWGE